MIKVSKSIIIIKNNFQDVILTWNLSDKVFKTPA